MHNNNNNNNNNNNKQGLEAIYPQMYTFYRRSSKNIIKGAVSATPLFLFTYGDAVN